MTFERTITITVEAKDGFEADEQAKMVANHIYSALDIKARANELPPCVELKPIPFLTCGTERGIPFIPDAMDKSHANEMLDRLSRDWMESHSDVELE